MNANDSDRLALLRRRAQALAQPPAAPPEAGSQLEVLVFGLADEHYALETAHVHEVLPLRTLTPLPGTPPFMRGLVNLRGRLLPVYDLKRFFELPEHGITDLHHVLVLRDAACEIGLLADGIEEIRRLPAAELQPALPTLGGIRSDFLIGVTAERLVLLDAARLLGDRRLQIDDAVDS